MPGHCSRRRLRCLASNIHVHACHRPSRHMRGGTAASANASTRAQGRAPHSHVLAGPALRCSWPTAQSDVAFVVPQATFSPHASIYLRVAALSSPAALVVSAARPLGHVQMTVKLPSRVLSLLQHHPVAIERHPHVLFSRSAKGLGVWLFDARHNSITYMPVAADDPRFRLLANTTD